MAERILVVGGARSGKSAFAESILARTPTVVYVAACSDADAGTDPEMAARIAAHQARRPPSWHTVDLDVAARGDRLADAVRQAPPDAGILVDALGGWVTGRMEAHRLWAPAGVEVAPLRATDRAGIDAIAGELAAFWRVAAGHPGGPVVVVAEQAGAGLVPTDPSIRRWLDVLGDCVQRLAADADRVLLVVAGRALELPARSQTSQSPGVWCAQTPHVPPAPALRMHGDRMVHAGALDFAVNVHGERPPPHVLAALDAAAANGARYPDDSPARSAAARRHGRAPAEILACAGAAEAFWVLSRVLRARLAAVVHPGFTEPEAALRAAGVPVMHVHRRADEGWALDPAAVPDDADVVVLANPTNPTGVLDPPERIAVLCRPGRVVLVDEAFMDFVPDPTVSLAGRRDLPGLAVTRSVTKLWGLAGIRAGYLVAPDGLVARCGDARQPWAVSAPALAALCACIDDEAYRLAVCAEVAAARRRLADALRRLPGVQTWDSVANFLLLRVPDGPQVVGALRERGVAVRRSTFPGLDENHLRITVRDDERNRLLVDALGGALQPLRAVRAGTLA
jgi:histidinol-phosphate/aromatic aminotransferase/cobyric acid decarboxylase-like protein/adenosyl cobinamide kinase/adenosyl cobinamide phosphate guanylyltransferase